MLCKSIAELLHVSQHHAGIPPPHKLRKSAKASQRSGGIACLYCGTYSVGDFSDDELDIQSITLKILDMKAARFYGNGDIRVEEVPEPVPKNGEVLVDVEWCGICGKCSIIPTFIARHDVRSI